MAAVTPGRIQYLKGELLDECYRIADDLGLDLEGEAIRHGLLTPRQVRNAFDGMPPRLSLTRLVDFLFTLRSRYNFPLPEEEFISDEPCLPFHEGDDDDGIPW
ncbi:hypothetical protein [Sphingomonas hengshuiensis]|uniref:Uncharacterized protein n=1 Tax=Sphingomonas hengshuiensis TaxID=1609977 RepID=A0A7U4J7I8_9SPHN|nr:hypothetical protein [Sphingomonas hengshuiensis]AJP71703.1 hypothetical protein TS85_07770 [Sphingomonas hengshuiensis]